MKTSIKCRRRFRDLDTGEIVVSFLAALPAVEQRGGMDTFYFPDSAETKNFLRLSLDTFAGRLDKHGREIYTNDFVKTEGGFISPVVRHEDGKYGTTNRYFVNGLDYEVVGDIYSKTVNRCFWCEQRWCVEENVCADCSESESYKTHKQP